MRLLQKPVYYVSHSGSDHYSFRCPPPRDARSGVRVAPRTRKSLL